MLLTERFFFTCVKFLQEAEAFCPQTSKNNKKNEKRKRVWEVNTMLNFSQSAQKSSEVNSDHSAGFLLPT